MDYVIAIPLISQFRIYADSTTVYKTTDLVAPRVNGLMPLVGAVWVESLLTNCDDNEIDWNINMFAGFDRNNEFSTAMFSADQTLKGSQRVNSSLTTTDFRRHTRLQLKWRLHSGMVSPVEGEISLVMYAQLLGGV